MTKNYTLREVLGTLLLVLAPPVFAQFSTVDVPLIEVNGDPVLSASAMHTSVFDPEQTDTPISNAVEVNDWLVTRTDSHFDEVKPKLETFGEDIQSGKKVAALIQLDANDVTYDGAWLWGNQVLLGVTYSLRGRAIPWRSDYLCAEPTNCKLLVKPQDQFFEMTYVLMKDGVKRANAEREPKQSSAKRLTAYVTLPSPDAQPVYGQQAIEASESTMQWRLSIDPVDKLLTRSDTGWPATNDDVFTTALSQLLNQSISSAVDLLGDNDNTPLDQKKIGYFEYIDAGAGLTAKRLAYQKQLDDYLTSWQAVRLVGVADMGERGYIYFSPYTDARKVQQRSHKAPLAVFEFRRSADQVTVIPGLSRDIPAKLLTHTHFLNALRATQQATAG